MQNQDSPRPVNELARVVIAMLVLATTLLVGAAWGQDGTELHRQIRQDIEQYRGLDGQHRQQMQANLDACVRLGMTDHQIRAMFPETASPAASHGGDMLAMQDRVIGVATNGVPVDLMVSKIMEGRMKHVPAKRLLHAVDRAGHDLETSHRVMMGAIDGGVTGPTTMHEMHEANSELARCLWDGLDDGDMEHLAEQSRIRAREGSCHVDDLVAASQAANRFSASGMSRHQAVSTAGSALHQGYSAEDMRVMGDMMIGSAHMGEHHVEMVEHMPDWIHDGMSMDEMTRHMMEGGWMGPADMMGPGGHQPMDNMGGHGGTHGGTGDGMGGGDHDGGGSGEHDGGGMGGG